MLDKLKMLMQARDIQKKLGEITTMVNYNGITIEINGRQEIINLEISESLFNDSAKLKELLKEAFNQAIKKSQQEMATKMQGEMGGMFGI